MALTGKQNCHGDFKRQEDLHQDWTGFTDMRKQISGLAEIVKTSLSESPLSGTYFVFCGKTRRVIKMLYWDATDFCLWQKRLKSIHKTPGAQEHYETERGDPVGSGKSIRCWEASVRTRPHYDQDERHE